jgi:hypothetical protein
MCLCWLSLIDEKKPEQVPGLRAMRSPAYTLKKFFSLSVNRLRYWGMFACLFSATRQLF